MQRKICRWNKTWT